MNIVFLTLGYPTDINSRNLYTDLMTSFVQLGHSVTVYVQDEIGNKKEQVSNTGVSVVPIFTGTVTKTSFIKKGINLLLLENRFYKTIQKYQKKSIDLLMYSTPPITFCGVAKKLKKRFNCKNYLLLKDIFPQNAVDLKIFSSKSLFYYYFRNKEKKLYAYSDYIGCMSPANVRYIKEHNKGLDYKVCVSPNCIIPSKVQNLQMQHNGVRLIYGGNLGKPQGISFIIECCKIIEQFENVEFTIVGSGTEYPRLEKAIKDFQLTHTKLLQFLPKPEYLKLIIEQDMGMIFLDEAFSIPNFPSRVLDYMDMELPVFACTDVNSDIKQEICDEGCGVWCKSGDTDAFRNTLDSIAKNKQSLILMRQKAHELLSKKYNAENEAKKICQTVFGK